MSEIKKKYYTITEISRECKTLRSKILYWISSGLSQELGHIRRCGNKRLFDERQKEIFLKFNAIMSSGEYTIKGGLIRIKDINNLDFDLKRLYEWIMDNYR